MDFFASLISILDATIRLSVPLLLACLAGLYSERAGVFDIGLEGKMLAGAFAGGAVAVVIGLGLARPRSPAILASVALRAGPRLRLDHPARQPDRLRRRHQLHRRRPRPRSSARPGSAQGGRTPPLGDDARFLPDHAARRRGGARRADPRPALFRADLRPLVLVYLAFLVVPLTWWVLYRTRFGLRLRAVGENPAAVDTAGISVAWLRYRAVICTGVLCGIAGAYLVDRAVRRLREAT